MNIYLIALILSIIAASITILYFMSEIFDVDIVDKIDEAVGQYQSNIFGENYNE